MATNVEDVEHDLRPGRSSTSRTDENIETVVRFDLTLTGFQKVKPLIFATLRYLLNPVKESEKKQSELWRNKSF